MKRSWSRSLFRFLLHLSIVYLVAKFAVFWPMPIVHDRILPFLGMRPEEGRFTYAFNHLFLFSVICGACAGIIAAKYRDGAAQWVWLVPTCVFAYKFATFPSSLFEDHFALAYHHYLAGGFLIPEFHTFKEMFEGWNTDYERGLDQIRFTVPVYVSLAYGCASWVGARLGIRVPGLEATVAAGIPASGTVNAVELSRQSAKEST
jgi:hypothetical protein